MSLDSFSARTSEFLAHQAPSTIRRAYNAVISESSLASRHHRLCQLAEASLSFFSSLVLSDYRSHWYTKPDRRFETSLGSTHKLSNGRYVEFIRLGEDINHPLTFRLGSITKRSILTKCGAFSGAISGIEQAIDVQAKNLARAVEIALSTAPKQITWLAFWDRFVKYRNRSEGHSLSYEWPIDNPEYYEVMTPILEAALVEALADPSIIQLCNQFPVMTLRRIRYDEHTYLHDFTGECGGLTCEVTVPAEHSVTDKWKNDGWTARVGNDFVLHVKGANRFDIHSIFYDLLKTSAPAPLPILSSSDPPPATGAASIPATRAKGLRLCGREAEMHQVEQVLEQVTTPIEAGSQRNGRVILLLGDSGIGKSAFARGLCGIASDAGFDVVDVICEPFQQGVSLFAIREVVRRVSHEDSLVREIVRLFGPSSSQAALAQLAEDPAADPAQRREALLGTFANVLYGRFDDRRSRYRAKPLLILIDDLELIDPGSADALLCTISRLREGPIVLVGSCRVAPGHHGHGGRPSDALMHAIRHREEICTVIRLEPLSRNTILDVTATVLGGPCKFPPRFYSRLYDETEGNPLFIRELLRNLSSPTLSNRSAPLRQVNGVWTVTGDLDSWDIPTTVEEAILGRLAHLDLSQRSALEKAAVIGRRFAFHVLTKVTARPEQELIRDLEQFINIDILRETREEDETFEFSHGKIRDVLYQGMTGLQRKRIHSEVADVLLAVQPAAGESWDGLVGEHLYLARRYGEACPRLLAAARASMSMYSLRDAVSQFRKAIVSADKSALPSTENRSRLRLEQATALKLASEFDEAAHIFAEIATSADQELRGWALNHIADIHWLRGNPAAAIEAYAQCEDIARAEGLADLLCETVADICELHDRETERIAGIDAEAVGEHRLAWTRYLDEQIRLAALSSDGKVQSRALRNSAKRRRCEGRLDQALDEYEQALALEDARIATHQVLISYAKTLRFANRGTDALTTVQRVLDWSLQTGSRRTEAIARQYLGLLIAERSSTIADAMCALEQLNAALTIHTEIDYRRGKRETHILIGEWYARNGDWPTASVHFARAIEHTETDGARLIEIVVAQLRAIGEERRASCLLELYAAREVRT